MEQSIKCWPAINEISAVAGWAKDNPHYPGRMGIYTLLWLSEGAMTVCAGREPVTLGKNTLYFITPGQRMALAAERPLFGVALSFTRQFIESWDDEVFSIRLFPMLMISPSLTVFRDEDTLLINAIVQKMLVEATSDRAFKAQVLKRFLSIFFAMLFRQLCLPGTGSEIPKKILFFNRFHRLMEDHFPKKRMVQEYADLLGVSASHLNSVIRRASGFPASFYIRQRLMQAIRRAALERVRSMKEIAYQYGFSDPSHFCKFFQKNFGRTFSEFRGEAGGEMAG